MINTTEKVLRELEAYKTPLLPTRLQGSTVIPEMFKTKKARRIALMHDREKKPRLGMADKASASEKSADEAAGVKPYAGRGGMKKLLARRQMEEEEEKEKERASAIETDEEEAEQTRHAKALNEKLVEELRKAPAVPEPERPRSFVGGREQSSLRVGRQRTSRNHIVRPQAKPRGGRFSAIYEDDDEDGMEEHETEREIRELEEAAKKVPTFNIPAGFSFAKDVRLYFSSRILSLTFIIDRSYQIRHNRCERATCCLSAVLIHGDLWTKYVESLRRLRSAIQGQ